MHSDRVIQFDTLYSELCYDCVFERFVHGNMNVIHNGKEMNVHSIYLTVRLGDEKAPLAKKDCNDSV